MVAKGGEGEKVFRLILDSHVGELVKLEKYVDRMFEEMGIDDGDLRARIFVCISEAVRNAMEHGNKFDPSKKVYLEAVVRADSIEVCVEDEGSGFDAERLPDPTSEEFLESERGRGIFLIRSLADSLSFEERGRRVVMGFQLQGVCRVGG